jgi:sugar phosphate permease
LLLVAYASFYLCRANVDAALPLLEQAGYDKVSLGQLSSIATLTYAIGKIVLGATGDVLGGRRLMLVAIGGSVVCSFAIGMQSTLAMLILFAAANRFFQAGGWSGLVQVVSQTFEPRRHGVVMGILSTSYEIGNVFALTLSAFVAKRGWQALFVVNPILFAVIGGAVVFSLPRGRGETGEAKPTPRDADEPARPAATAPYREQAAKEPEKRESFWQVFRALSRQGAFWTTVVLSALLTFIRVGFLTWTPTYLFEVSRASGHTEVSGAIVKSAMFPAAGVIAALSVGPIGDRLGRGRRAPIMAVSLLVVVALVLLLAHGGVRDPFSAAALIASIGLFLLGPYSLLAGAMALDVSGKRGAATAAGIIDCAGYLGATASGVVLGTIAHHFGWSAAFDVVAVAAFLATALSAAWSVVALGREPKAPEAAPVEAD